MLEKDTYRDVIWGRYGRNLDRALSPKTVIGTCPICKSDMLKYDSGDYSGIFCSNPECVNHKDFEIEGG